MAYDASRVFTTIGSIRVFDEVVNPSTGSGGVIVDLFHNREVRARITAIRKLSTLGGNWDGYGSIPPSDSALEMAERFVRDLPRDKKLVEQIKPDGEGGVSLFWSNLDERTIMTFDGAELHMSRERQGGVYDLPAPVPYFSPDPITDRAVLDLIPNQA